MKRKDRMRKSNAENMVVELVVAITLLVVFIITLYPFYYMVLAAFSDGYDFAKGGVYLWPRKFTMANIRYFFSQSIWVDAFWISVLRTLIGTLVTTSLTSIFAYGLSYEKLMFRKTYLVMVVFAMYVSGGIIPLYVVLRFMGLLNTFAVYILPTGLNLFFVVVGINFFSAVPSALKESAYLDGASEYTTFLRIILPVSKPYFATLILFSAVQHWNSWMDSMYYVNAENLRTLAYRMNSEINKVTSSAGGLSLSGDLSSINALSIRSAAVVISVVPILMVYPGLQKYFVQGMTVGAVKE